MNPVPGGSQRDKKLGLPFIDSELDVSLAPDPKLARAPFGFGFLPVTMNGMLTAGEGEEELQRPWVWLGGHVRPIIKPSPAGGHGEVLVHVDTGTPPPLREAWGSTSHSHAAHTTAGGGAALRFRGSLKRAEGPDSRAALEEARRAEGRTEMERRVVKAGRGGTALYWMRDVAAAHVPSVEELRRQNAEEMELASTTTQRVGRFGLGPGAYRDR